MTSQPNSEIVLGLAEEFIGRYRRGERPALAEYIEKFPELADEIREVLPAMAMLENIAPGDASLAAQPGENLCTAAPFDQLGDYRIIREVGRGGMGIVYEAEQLSLGRHVALKLLSREARGDPRFARRFEREARAAARLHHTNIVPVFGVGEHEGMQFYVMQFIQGLGLDEVLRELQRLRDSGVSPTAGDPKGEFRRPKLPLSPTECARSLILGDGDQTGAHRHSAVAPLAADPQVAETNSWTALPGRSDNRHIAADTDRTIAGGALSDTIPASDLAAVLPGRNDTSSKNRTRIPAYWQSIAQIGLQVAGALQHAHEQGILHRDVKPSNLLLDTRGTVWVADFGLAKTNDQQDLTHSGDLLGTFRYMSPEAFDGQADLRSDVYSLGLTLYELAALRPAYDEVDRPRLVKQITTTDPPRLDKLNPDVPRDLATVIQKAIDRDSDDRYQTAAALAADLARFLDDEPIHARRPSLRDRLMRWARRNRQLAAALSIIAVLLVAGAVAASIAASNFRNVAVEMTGLARQRETDRRQAVEARDDAIVARHSEQDLRERETELRRQAESAQALANERAETVRQNLYFAQMSMAGHSWKGMTGARRMQDLLQKWRPAAPGTDATRDLRGWEWFYLASQFYRSQLMLREQAGPISMAAYSPDGSRFAIANSLRGAEIRDSGTGRLLVALHDHLGPVRAIAWNPDGTILAGAGDDQLVCLWDAASGSRLATLAGHENAIVAVDFSPDGKRLLSASRDQTIRLWDALEHRETAVLRGLAGDSHSARWSPNGMQIVSASSDGIIRLWNAQTNAEILKWNDQLWRPCVCWSPDGRYIACTSSDDLTIKLWDAQTGREARRFRGHFGEVVSVAFDASGQRLASSGIDGAALVWDVETGRPLAGFRGHTLAATWTCFSPDDTHLLSTGRDGVVQIWDMAQVQEFTELRGHTAYPKCLAWSPDGRRLASGGNDQTLHLWDVAKARETAAYRSGGGWIVAVSWHPRRPWIAAGHQDGTIRIREESTGRLLAAWAGHSGPVAGLAWSPDGERLGSCSHDGTVIIWDAGIISDPGQLDDSPDTGRQVSTLRNHTAAVTGLAFSPDGKSLATCSFDDTIRICETSAWTETAVLKGHTRMVNAVSWSPDSQRIASCSWDNTAKVWDVAAQKETTTLAGHVEILYTIAWSPDGTRIATAGMDREVKLWDAATGVEVISFDTHSNQIIATAWSPDGMQLATASFDRTVHILDAAPACERTGASVLLAALDRRLRLNPDSARDYSLRAQALTRLGEHDRAEAENDRTVHVYDRLIADGPTAERFGGEYAVMLLERALNQVEWVAVEPVELQSPSGATLICRPDKSILAAVSVPHAAAYEITVPRPAALVTGLRLEALPDASLPLGGSGLDYSGNFILTRMSVLTCAPAGRQSAIDLPLHSAWADFMQSQFRIGRVIEQPPRHEWGWAVNPAAARPHTAIFEFKPTTAKAAIASDTGERLTVRLECTHSIYSSAVLGNFRLSLTTAPAPARLLRLRDDLARSSARGWPRLAAVAALTGHRSAATTAIANAATLANGGPSAEELFLLALASVWLEQPDDADGFLARGLAQLAKEPLDATLSELACDAIGAVRHLGDTAAVELMSIRQE